MQDLLAADPSRVPGVGGDAMAVRELSTEAGPVDVCILNGDGDITVVECKLASNPERRRMVVGQVLDYAAAIWTAGPDEFVAAWRARGGNDLAEELPPDAYQRMRSHVGEGRIHLCLAVDLIDAELRRLIEFLNRVTRPGVMVTASQLTYARHGDVEILIPTTFGAELAAAKHRERTSGDRWSRERFLEAIDNDRGRLQVERLFERLDQLADRLGPNEPLWFGAYPNGGIYLQPYGVHYALSGCGSTLGVRRLSPAPGTGSRRPSIMTASHACRTCSGRTTTADPRLSLWRISTLTRSGPPSWKRRSPLMPSTRRCPPLVALKRQPSYPDRPRRRAGTQM
jgi:hypothetical protein